VRRVLSLLLLPLAVGCSEDSTPTGSLVLIPGQETDAFTREPKPATLELRLISAAGTVQEVASMAWPAGAFDVGDLPQDQTGSFEAVGLDSSGKALLLGRTVPVQLASLDGAQLPLFMGRTAEMARPPDRMSTGRVGGVTGIVDGYLLITAGGEQVTDASGNSLAPSAASAYDVGLWGPLDAVPLLPRVPKSLVVIGGRYGLLVDDSGATWSDFDSANSNEAEPPAGSSFADVSGGSPIHAKDGSAWLFGATRRTGTPTSAVIAISTSLSLATVSLAAPRLGAAVALMPSGGVVIAGGAPGVAGVELLAGGASASTPLAFPADPVAGASAVALDASRVLLAGGVAPDGTPASPRIVDISCASSCAPAVLADDGDALLLGSHLHALSAGRALLVGEAPAGTSDAGRTRVVLLTISGQSLESTVIPLREPRKGAVSAMLPTGMPVVCGGLSPEGQPVRSIEVFTPPQ